MSKLQTAASADVGAWAEDGTWSQALRTVERHALRHLRDAGMSTSDIGMEIVEAEQVDRPGRPALKIVIGGRDAGCLTYIDWNGRLSWGRSRTWLDRNVLREVARRCWIMAMVEQGIEPMSASFEHRTIDPLLIAMVKRGSLSMEMLTRHHPPRPSMRFALGANTNVLRRYRGHLEHIEMETDVVPPMDIHVDHDMVVVTRMSLSNDVVYHADVAGKAVVRLGRCRLPHTALFGLSGRPLDDLVDSPLLDGMTMPVIERMRLRRGGSVEAVLKPRPSNDLSQGDVK